MRRSFIQYRCLGLLVSIFLIVILFRMAMIGNAASVPEESDGNELEKQIGQYVVSMHYPFAFMVGKPIAMNFFIDQVNSSTQVRFTDMHISISDDREQIFKATIARKPGIANAITVTFPAAGTYYVDSSFNNGTTTLAQASFDVHVSDTQRRILGLTFNKELLVGVILGVCIFGIWRLYVRWMRSQDIEDRSY